VADASLTLGASYQHDGAHASNTARNLSDKMSFASSAEEQSESVYSWVLGDEPTEGDRNTDSSQAGFYLNLMMFIPSVISAVP